MSKEDINKKAAVVDMMVTMHSVLAHRYAFRAKVMEAVIFLASIVIVSTTFLDKQLITHFGADQIHIQIIIGVSSILIVFISILQLIVDWKGTSIKHYEAFKVLLDLKKEWMKIVRKYDVFEDKELTEFEERSSIISSNLIPIPDNCFNNLKSHHCKKVELSKAISRNPGSNIILLKITLFFKKTVMLLSNELRGKSDDT